MYVHHLGVSYLTHADLGSIFGFFLKGKHPKEKVLGEIRDVQYRAWAAEVCVVAKGKNSSSRKFRFSGKLQGPKISGLPSKRPSLQ